MTSLNRIKLAKVLAMTGSQHDGERAAAAALAARMVRDAGLTWDALLSGGGAAPMGSPADRGAAWADGYARGKADAARAAQAAARAAEAEQAGGDRNWEHFKSNNPDLAAWIEREAQRGSTFAKSLWGGVRKFGSLTEKQEAAVRRNIARQREAQV